MAVTQLPRRNLDVLRAFAVLAVLVAHTARAHGINASIVWSFAHLGVLAFFVHTSLVLMGSMERLSGPHWIWAFYMQRAFRIYPLVWVLIIVCVVGHVPWTTTPEAGYDLAVAHSGPAVLTNIFLVQNLLYQPDVLVVLWSLPLEVQMYAMLPLCFLLARKGPRLTIGLAIISLLPAIFFVWGRAHDLRMIGRFGIIYYVPCFLGGVVAYSILKQAPQARVPAKFWIPMLLGLGTVAALGASVSIPSFPAWEWTFALALGLLIPFVGEMATGTITKAAESIARYSFGVYLFHMPLIYVAFILMHRQPMVLQWLVFATLVVSVPVLTYRLIEDPCVQLGRRLARRGTRRTFAVTDIAPRGVSSPANPAT
jgi:peptidoglycan/LPS O-acetylase OafA/YrhL